MGSVRSRIFLVGIIVACVAGIIAATGSTARSTKSALQAAEQPTIGAVKIAKIKPFWVYTGPVNDGGYNLEFEKQMKAVSAMPGVEPPGTLFNVPYTSQASNQLKLALAQGYNVIVDTAGLGPPLDAVCKANPQIACIETVTADPMPPNEHNWWVQDWNMQFIAGAAAGLMTKTHVVGVLGAYKIPIVQEQANAFLLGCQSVDPKCKERLVYTGTYFDPAKDAAAANTLVDAGADVLRNTTDDSAACEVAQKRGVYVVGQYYDFIGVCPKAVITSTVYDATNYLKAQFRKIQNGTFKGTGTHPAFVPMGSNSGSPRLGAWGGFVPASVKAKLKKLVVKAEAGQNLIVGPISDTKGKLRFAAGVHPTPEYMLSQWSWPVKGIGSSK